jgi:hypothetical protein
MALPMACSMLALVDSFGDCRPDCKRTHFIYLPKFVEMTSGPISLLWMR